tara:strand:- start:363 stop:596 length:234 start_codon:yes stop_codon:yes gene_type:complete
MTYPKQVVLIINHSKDERQIKRITFQTLEEHREYIQNLDTNQQLIEDEEDEPLSPSQLLRNVFSDIGQAYKDFNSKN